MNKAVRETVRGPQSAGIVRDDMIGLVMTVPISPRVTPNATAAIDGPALIDLLGHWSSADGPLYRLLAARIGRLADTGALPAGLRLPPERELAGALAVSRNTVAMAYQLLRDDGMAQSRQGSGTRIVPHRVTPAGTHRPTASSPACSKRRPST